MKSTIFALCSFLAAFGAAVPTTPTVTLQLANDLSGANNDQVILADGSTYAISDLFSGTSVDVNGQILVTSAQLVAFPTFVQCAIFEAQSLVTVLTQDHTFADLDGNSATTIPVELNNAWVSCFA
jgi:hypothetical protein